MLTATPAVARDRDDSRYCGFVLKEQGEILLFKLGRKETLDDLPPELRQTVECGTEMRELRRELKRAETAEVIRRTRLFNPLRFPPRPFPRIPRNFSRPGG
jgi:hypothetical protein